MWFSSWLYALQGAHIIFPFAEESRSQLHAVQYSVHGRPSHHFEVGHFIDSSLRRIVTYW